MPAATRSPLAWVLCTSTTRLSSCAMYSGRSAEPTPEPARGSPWTASGSGSLATSSDWTTSRAASSTGSTSYRIAATARCTNETSRTEDRRTTWPAGDAHSASRRNTPARRSSTRRWLRSSP